MAKRVIITDNGEHAYPLTTTENVFDESGVPVSEVIANKANIDHIHDEYARLEEIIPINQLNSMFDAKAAKVHEHTQYLTQDDLNIDNELSILQSINQIDQIVTGNDEDGNPIYSSIQRNHTKMNNSTNQYTNIMTNTILDLPQISSSDFCRLYLYMELTNNEAVVTLPGEAENVKYNIDMTDFTIETGKVYEFCFTLINQKWLCNIRIY